MGLAAPRHVGYSWTRARTRVPCIGRWILNHCTTREAPCLFSYESISNTSIWKINCKVLPKIQKMVICSFLLAHTFCLQMAASPLGGNLFHQGSLSAFQKPRPSWKPASLLPAGGSSGSWSPCTPWKDSELHEPTTRTLSLPSGPCDPNTQVREAHLTGTASVTHRGCP